MQFPPTFLIILHSLHEPRVEEKQKLSRAYHLEVLQYWFPTEGHRSSLWFFQLFPKQNVRPKQHILGRSDRILKMIKKWENWSKTVGFLKFLKHKKILRRYNKKLLRTSDLLHYHKNGSFIQLNSRLLD